ncbi:Succinate dehydrogenase/Fumarate reductase transmembrane subunit [Acididesulfobacillus acetoxydans]|uniref:Succinate dehydrogenase cytochrome b558 subunit n=1 Tax=Acididesulfobacillus acetoxydans TaxID=1561005 RepID=A0A8S0W8J4_9FIRM|nr:succinate dehydrogenase cytochrome b558 subunit [Acididesulfobacillus acetoxydans]CAA7601859.1 Succinate dehydrogenase/Fumarate reductase transmembrane subunit [Acididesulfobacillus acetoxydans]CEJ08666.1 Succinate dehydrogenase cytochrome b558 subunit [Acididesulfobacillus acetoxydans]
MSTVQSQSPYHFLIRRVHSLLGLLPIGVFLTFHLLLNLTARSGPAAYDRVIETMRHFPGIIVVELVVIFIPITLHAVYGAWVVYTGQSNVLRYGYARNWFYILQRISGLYTVIFILVHVSALRFGQANFAALQHFVANPWGLAFYAVGIVLAVFHFMNGLWAFAITWGLTIGPRSQKIWSYVCGFLFVVMSVVGLADLSAFLR